MPSKHYLFLDDITLVLMEWIPIGRHTIKFLQDKLECLNPNRDFFVTSSIHRQRNATTIDVGASEVMLRVEAFDPLENISFVARVDIASTGSHLQEELIGVHVTRHGRLTYGLQMEPRSQDDSSYSVDDLSYVVADLIEDSSDVMATILNAYQKRLLDIVFCEQSRDRDKFIILTAKRILPGITDPLEVHHNAACQSELKQILGAAYPDLYCRAPDGTMFFVGENGVLVVGEHCERYHPMLELYGLMGSIVTFQNNIFSRLSWSWDLLYEQKRRVGSEGSESIVDIQATLSNLSADQGLLLSVPSRLKDAMADISKRIEALHATGEGHGDYAFFKLIETVFGRSQERILEAHEALTALGREIENVRSLASALSEKETYGINRAMNILTVVSVIILPLSLITGIYGMNFMRYIPDGEIYAFWNMPMLYMKHGYLTILSVMLLVASSLTFYFWKQGLLPKKRRKKGLTP
ncbi:MAG: hypothetical protein O3A51_05960 [Verrucomicrobia bacterium]|nr:hypothetical protein [Verrucomicrobiota bacterium]